MINGIGGGGGLEREAILAAMKSVAKQASAIHGAADEISKQSSTIGRPEGPEKAQGFAQQLGDSLKAVDAQIKGVERLPEDLISGKVESIHEVAVQMKKAEFSFRFAMEIRNKLIESYREVMRMSV